MHVLLVGHTAAVPRLKALAKALREMPGTFTSLYVDRDLDLMNEMRELPRADFLLLGLSRESMEPKSAVHRVEADLVKRASTLNPPMYCCIVCDEHGHISPPFLTQLGSKVRLVVAQAVNPGCNITELCEYAKPLYLEDIEASALDVASAIYDIVYPAKMRESA